MSRAGFAEAEPWIIRGRNLSAAEVASIGELVEQNRSLSRLGLAVALCELWQWRSANGRWKTLRIIEGEKGPIVAGFARLRVYTSADRTPASERWLLLRDDPNTKIKNSLRNAPESCPLAELVRVREELATWTTLSPQPPG